MLHGSPGPCSVPPCTEQALVCALSTPRSQPRGLWPPSCTAPSIPEKGDSTWQQSLPSVSDSAGGVSPFYTVSERAYLSLSHQSIKTPKDWRTQNKVTGMGSLPKSECTKMSPWPWGAEKLTIDLSSCATSHSVLQPETLHIVDGLTIAHRPACLCEGLLRDWHPGSQHRM